MAGITRQKQRRVIDSNLVGADEGVLQAEMLAAFDGTGEPVGFAIGPVDLADPDATTPANTLTVYPMFTPALKEKIDGIEAEAGVNPPLLSPEELAALDGTDPRTFTPAQVAAAIAARATGDVLTVNGEIGDVEITSGNLPEEDDKFFINQARLDKLDGIGAGAQPLSIPTVVSGLDGYLGAENWRANSGVAYTAPVTMTFVGSQSSWVNKPVTGTPGEFSSAPTRYRVDARGATDIQLFGSVNIAADGTHRLLLRYNITADAVGEGGTWVVITDSDISIATTGDKVSAVAVFPDAAKIDNLWIQLAGDAATGTTQSPKFTQVRAVMNVAVDTAASVASTQRSRVIAVIPASTTYTGAPVGETEWRSAGGIGETCRWFADFSRTSQYQIKVRVGGASTNGAILHFEYSTDGGSTWTPLSGATLSAYTTSAFDKLVGGGWLTPPAGVGACMVRMTLENTTAGTISPVLSALYMVCDETEPTPFTAPKVAVFTQPLPFGHAVNQSWVIPTGTNEIGGSGVRIPVDLRNVSEICIMLATQVGAPADGTVAQIEWSLTNNGSDFATIPGTPIAIDGALGQKVGAWATVPDAAKVQELTWLRATATATAGATTSFRMVAAIIKQLITAVLPNAGGGDATTYGEIGASTTGTITGPDVDVVLCFNTAAISVNLPAAPRKSQVYRCYGAALSFFGGAGQTIQGGNFTGAAGTLAIPKAYSFVRRLAPNDTVWTSGQR